MCKLLSRAHLSNAQPVCEVSCVGECCGEPNHSHRFGGVGRDEICPRHNDLQNRPSVLPYAKQDIQL